MSCGDIILQLIKISDLKEMGNRGEKKTHSLAFGHYDNTATRTERLAVFL